MIMNAVAVNANRQRKELSDALFACTNFYSTTLSRNGNNLRSTATRSKYLVNFKNPMFPILKLHANALTEWSLVTVTSNLRNRTLYNIKRFYNMPRRLVTADNYCLGHGCRLLMLQPVPMSSADSGDNQVLCFQQRKLSDFQRPPLHRNDSNDTSNTTSGSSDIMSQTKEPRIDASESVEEENDDKDVDDDDEDDDDDDETSNRLFPHFKPVHLTSYMANNEKNVVTYIKLFDLYGEHVLSNTSFPKKKISESKNN